MIERQRVTNAVLVPTMIQMLLGVPGAAERDYSALRSIAYGASPITTPVLKAALRTFGCSLYGIYGLTESTGGVMQLDPADHDPGGPREHLLRRAGRPFPWVELRIVDPVTGAERAAGRDRRGVAARAERHARLLQPARGDGRRADRRRLAAHRRRRLPRRGRLPLPHRPDQGHDRQRRRERVSGRGRGGALAASGRRRGRRHRRARRALGRDGQGARRRARRQRADRGRADRVRARAARRLQAAALGRLRRRAPAHAERQGAEARAARSATRAERTTSRRSSSTPTPADRSAA